MVETKGCDRLERFECATRILSGPGSVSQLSRMPLGRLLLVTENEYAGKHISSIGIIPSEEMEAGKTATSLYYADIVDEKTDFEQKFIYVFSKSARDRLLAANYNLLKSDEQNEVYVFANQMDMTFALADISFIRSNTLTF